jgi:hypothetical protein
MSGDSLNYKIRLLYEINISKHRIDDQYDPENREWCLYVFDRNAGMWVPTNTLNNEGESSVIKLLQVSKE